MQGFSLLPLVMLSGAARFSNMLIASQAIGSYAARKIKKARNAQELTATPQHSKWRNFSTASFTFLPWHGWSSL